MIRGIGWVLIACGILVNPLVLGWLIAEDGRIESALFNGVILLADLLTLAAGVYLVRNPRGAALANVALLALSVVVAILLAEVGARLSLFGWSTFSPADMASVPDSRLRDFVREVDNPEIGFALKPNLDVLFKLAPLQTNDAGLHDVDYSRQKSNDVFRIVVVGDSFTMPAGVALEDAWHSRIEAALNAERDGTRYEVINFGVAGYDLRQYAAVMETVAAEYAPDLVLLGFCAENDHQVGENPAAMIAKTTQKRLLPESYLFKLLSQLNYASHASMSKRPTLQEEAYIAEQFGRIAAATTAPVLVAYLANLPRDGAGAIGELAITAGFGFVDASQAFADKRLATYSIFHPVDSHPNAAANRIFSAEILRYLRENGEHYPALPPD
jgi:lysophospholipase L1-like esterase